MKPHSQATLPGLARPRELPVNGSRLGAAAAGTEPHDGQVHRIESVTGSDARCGVPLVTGGAAQIN